MTRHRKPQLLVFRSQLRRQLAMFHSKITTWKPDVNHTFHNQYAFVTISYCQTSFVLPASEHRAPPNSHIVRRPFVANAEKTRAPGKPIWRSNQDGQSGSLPDRSRCMWVQCSGRLTQIPLRQKVRTCSTLSLTQERRGGSKLSAPHIRRTASA